MSKFTTPYGNAVDPELTVYPQEQPSMILFTFKPSVTGTYTAEICTTNENPDTDAETNAVMFVYKEMHGPSGENGYYTRFVITDNNGSAVADLTVPEIIQLRKNFNNAHPYYLDEVYGSDNDNGTRSRHNESGEDITKNLDGNTTGEGEEDYGGFNAYMSNLKSSAGIVDGDEEADAEAAGFSSAADQGVTQIESVIYGVPYEDASS